MSSYYKSALRCASPSAYESGIFELLGSCTPLAYFFLLLKKVGRRRHRRQQTTLESQTLETSNA